MGLGGADWVGSRHVATAADGLLAWPVRHGKLGEQVPPLGGRPSLLFLLAARRGLRSDPAFEALNVPDDRIMTYSGKAGVEIFNKKPLSDRIIAVFGNFANR